MCTFWHGIQAVVQLGVFVGIVYCLFFYHMLHDDGPRPKWIMPWSAIFDMEASSDDFQDDKET